MAICWCFDNACNKIKCSMQQTEQGILSAKLTAKLTLNECK